MVLKLGSRFMYIGDVDRKQLGCHEDGEILRGKSPHHIVFEPHHKTLAHISQQTANPPSGPVTIHLRQAIPQPTTLNGMQQQFLMTHAASELLIVSPSLTVVGG